MGNTFEIGIKHNVTSISSTYPGQSVDNWYSWILEVDKVADKVANMATDKNKPRAILPKKFPEFPFSQLA